VWDREQQLYAEGLDNPDKPIPFGTPRAFVETFLRGQQAGLRARERERATKVTPCPANKDYRRAN
jgi:hypothetical protein